MEKEISGQQMEATWIIALKIWWWVAWRSFLLSFLIGMISLLVIFLPISAKTSNLIFTFISSIGALIIYLYFLKKVLNREFKEFTLALIRRH